MSRFTNEIIFRLIKLKNLIKEELYNVSEVNQTTLYIENNVALRFSVKKDLLDILGEKNFEALAENAHIVHMGESKRLIEHESPEPKAYDLNSIDELIKEIQGDEFYETYIQNSYYRIYQDFKFIKKFAKKWNSILDIGSIPPIFSTLLSNEGYQNITAFDPAVDRFADYLNKKKINYIKGNILEDKLTGEYDVVCANEVIEHISGNLIDVIQKITSVIKKDGYLFITTPNQASIQGMYSLFVSRKGLASKIDCNVYNQYQRYVQCGYYGHIREYTDREIEEFLENFGLKLVEKTFDKDDRLVNNNSWEGVLLRLLELCFPSRRLFAKYCFKKVC